MRLAILPLVLVACGGESRVREPSPQERTAIVAAAKGVYDYESDVVPYRRFHLRPSRLHPQVVSIRVSRSRPPFASAAVELRDARGRRTRGAAIVVFDGGGGSWGEATVAATDFPLACTAATPRGVRDLLCPDPWSVLDYPRPRVPLNTAVENRLRSPDLHAADWGSVVLPGAACGATRPIRLRHGEALVKSATEPWWPAVVVGAGRTFYGDLDGDGRDEAAVGVVCSNGGGTAAGQLAFASVVFAARGRSLRVVGIITPRQPFDPETAHVPLVGFADMKIRRGSVIAPEFWYGPNDGTCCASGRAKTTWTYAKGRLRPSGTIVEREPRG